MRRPTQILFEQFGLNAQFQDGYGSRNPKGAAQDHDDPRGFEGTRSFAGFAGISSGQFVSGNTCTRTVVGFEYHEGQEIANGNKGTDPGDNFAAAFGDASVNRMDKEESDNHGHDNVGEPPKDDPDIEDGSCGYRDQKENQKGNAHAPGE